MKIDPENRRSFVKKSLATSLSISFAGLIRAHGDGGGNGYTTTADPWGGTTTASTTEETTTAVSQKPKTRIYQVKVWVKDYDNQGEPIFTLSEAEAKLHMDLVQPSVPEITGNPAADGTIGTLKAGLMEFDSRFTVGTSIDTNETHTSIILGGHLTPNPKITYDVLEVGNGQRKKYFDVQISYKWVYPSSP